MVPIDSFNPRIHCFCFVDTIGKMRDRKWYIIMLFLLSPFRTTCIKVACHDQVPQLSLYTLCHNEGSKNHRVHVRSTTKKIFAAFSRPTRNHYRFLFDKSWRRICRKTTRARLFSPAHTTHMLSTLLAQNILLQLNTLLQSIREPFSISQCGYIVDLRPTHCE